MNKLPKDAQRLEWEQNRRDKDFIKSKMNEGIIRELEMNPVSPENPYTAKLPIVGKIFPKTKSIELTEDSIVNSIIEMFVKRSKIGKEKYGVTLDRDDLTLEDWLTHSLEEQLDNILYTYKALTKLKEKNEGTDK